MKLKLRQFRKGDEVGITKLDNSLLTHKCNKRNLKNWYWKYRSKHSTSKPIIIVAELAKKIIGHFAIIQTKYLFNEKKINGSHSVGLMVDKKWQSRGIVKFLSATLITSFI